MPLFMVCCVTTGFVSLVALVVSLREPVGFDRADFECVTAARLQEFVET
jgi:hypothetical protein